MKPLISHILKVATARRRSMHAIRWEASSNAGQAISSKKSNMLSMTFRRRRPMPGRSDNRAVAALEFALTAPLVLLFLGAASDYGMMVWDRNCLVNAVAQGGYFAFRTGTGVTKTSVETLVAEVSSLQNVNVTASDPTKCYCPTATTVPATLGPAVSCTSTCAAIDGNNSDTTTPGNYMKINATYTLGGFFNLGGLSTAGMTLSETVTVRLK
jgi:Flp pilus assembly protein TadG